jgi:hypothetical protein
MTPTPKNDEPTNTEILVAINDFANKNEERLSGIEKNLREIKSTMVTKDYLDERLAVQKGDMITIIRKEDTKLIALIVKMVEKKLLSQNDAKEILSMEPFPDLRASLALGH